jgi:hypothetical protein
MKPLLRPQSVTYCVHKDCFGLKANENFTVSPSIRPVRGVIVAVIWRGKEVLARYKGPDVELPNGAFTFTYELIGVVL